MTDKAFVIPAEGLKIPDPKTGKPLPAEGASVELTSYWNRRIAHGDVTRQDDTPPAAPKKPKTV